jgi:hypothetical protein
MVEDSFKSNAPGSISFLVGQYRLPAIIISVLWKRVCQYVIYKIYTSILEGRM